MQNLTTESYLKQIHNVYSLVILAAKRTVGLTRGEKPLLVEPRRRKPMMIALDEIAAGKITIAPPEEIPDVAEEKIL